VTEDEAEPAHRDYEHHGGKEVEANSATTAYRDDVVVGGQWLLFANVIGGRIHMKLLWKIEANVIDYRRRV
jgi:hypothetical protein